MVAMSEMRWRVSPWSAQALARPIAALPQDQPYEVAPGGGTVAGGSSRPTSGIEHISTSADRRRSSSTPTAAARLRSARCRRPSTSNTVRPPSRLRGSASTKGTKFSGEGYAELLDDGSIEIEFEYDSGDEAVLKAKRDKFSTAC